MATGLYYAGLAAFLRGEIDWESDTIRAALIDTSLYTADLAADEYLSDVPTAAVITTALITNKSVVVNESGAAGDGDDISVSGISGEVCGAILVYKDTGTASTSRLISYYDDAYGLPLTLTGQTVIIVWDNADDRIIRLGPCAGGSTS